jgi:dihydropteroate synthase
MNKPRLMGIVNITPDSFSDGGRFYGARAAIEHALRMVGEGADIIDIGGESTRPGAQSVSAEEQKRRVLSVIEMLKKEISDHVAISIDTTLVEVARDALNAGADILNDVSAGSDAAMFELAADRRVPIILMHMQGTPRTMQDNPNYQDVVSEVKEFLLQRADKAQQLGVDAGQIIIDPGIGFGKGRQHNLELIANLDVFVETGYQVLLGASRKRFMGAICDVKDFHELVGATCATTALAVVAGVDIMRVHDVKPNRQALDVTWAVLQARSS